MHNNISLLKKILPGLLPLIVFVLADEIWGTSIGMVVALVFGILELGYFYIKDRRIDRFILIDTGFLVILGLISILLDNEIFFKLKPALIEGILVIILAYSVWGPKNLVMAMSKRYIKGIEIGKAQESAMRINIIVMFWITVLHIGLVIYSAYLLSNEAWVFISGGLFYIFFGVYFLFIWVSNYFKRKIGSKGFEMLPVIDEAGKVIRLAPRSECHNGKSKLLHPVIHLHIFNDDGLIFLQKRAANKDVQPSKWDTSVGGHIDPGETIEGALFREAKEETGLTGFKPTLLKKYIWESEIEREMVISFTTVTDMIPEIDKDEVSEGRFWSVSEIKANLNTGIFTPNFEHEFNLLPITKSFDGS